MRVAWMNNPKVHSSMHFDLPVLLDNTIAWYNRNLTRTDRADMVFTDNDGNLVAMGGLTGITADTRKAELYIFVSPEIQSRGIGTEATRLLCRYGFEALGLNKIFLHTNQTNLAAQRVYERCGFTLEGRLRQEAATADGELQDRLYYGLLKNEFPQ